MNEPLALFRTIRASRPRVYAAWTDPAVLRLWLAPGLASVEYAETDLRVGGRFRLETRGPDGARHTISGAYRALRPVEHILQTWIYDGPLDLLPGEEMLLQVDLVAETAETTALRLTHHRLVRSDVRDAYCRDWPTCFDKLEAALH